MHDPRKTQLEEYLNSPDQFIRQHAYEILFRSSTNELAAKQQPTSSVVDGVPPRTLRDVKALTPG